MATLTIPLGEQIRGAGTIHGARLVMGSILVVKLADALEVSVDELLGRVSVEANTQVDPLFLRASRAPTHTLDAVKRVTAALLDEDPTI